MKFVNGTFSCDAEVYRNGDDVAVRFYDKSKEHEASQIVNLVIVDPGFGYICLKFKDKDSGLLSGFFREDAFASDAMVQAAIDFVKDLTPLAKSAYIPHHVDRVKLMSYVEYNGEY